MTTESQWRVGRSVGRTLYLNNRLVGLMDTPELAAEVVAAVNSRLPPDLVQQRNEAMRQRDENFARAEAAEKAKNGAYHERNQVVVLVAKMALALGWNAGIREHPTEDKAREDDWRTLVFIDLPSGQVSWHFHDSEKHLLAGLPRYEREWDGHTTEEKYRRCADINPCGGVRCFRSEKTGEWIHSSKSYGTCRAAANDAALSAPPVEAAPKRYGDVCDCGHVRANHVHGCGLCECPTFSVMPEPPAVAEPVDEIASLRAQLEEAKAEIADHAAEVELADEKWEGRLLKERQETEIAKASWARVVAERDSLKRELEEATGQIAVSDRRADVNASEIGKINEYLRSGPLPGWTYPRAGSIPDGIAAAITQARAEERAKALEEAAQVADAYDQSFDCGAPAEIRRLARSTEKPTSGEPVKCRACGSTRYPPVEPRPTEANKERL